MRTFVNEPRSVSPMGAISSMANRSPMSRQYSRTCRWILKTTSGSSRTPSIITSGTQIRSASSTCSRIPLQPDISFANNFSNSPVNQTESGSPRGTLNGMTIQYSPPFSKKPRTTYSKKPPRTGCPTRSRNCTQWVSVQGRFSSSRHSFSCTNPTNTGTPVRNTGALSGITSSRYTPGAPTRALLAIRKSIAAIAIYHQNNGNLAGTRPSRLSDTKDHKLCRPDNRHADLCYDHPQITNLRRIGFGVALDIEGLLGCQAEQRTGTPYIGQKCADVATDLAPKCGIVWLKHHPLRSFIDRLAQEKEEPAHIDVLPLCVLVTANRARAPDGDVAIHVANAIHALGI